MSDLAMPLKIAEHNLFYLFSSVMSSGETCLKYWSKKGKMSMKNSYKYLYHL